MNTTEFKKNYLSHYCLLEKDFQSTAEFVTIEEDNYNTYSVAFLKLLLTIGSEIDVMLEFLAKLYDPNTKESGFGCSKVVLENEPDIKSLEIQVRSEGILVHPWNCSGIPEWWTVYNKIKHKRYESATHFDSARKYYQYANLKNVINSLAALLSLELYAYRFIALRDKEKRFAPSIKSIFTINNSYWKGIGVGGGYIFIDGDLYIDD